MNYCNYCNIAYDERNCPLCDANMKIKELEKEIDKLNNTLNTIELE